MARSTKDRSFDILSAIGSSLDLLDELWDTIFSIKIERSNHKLLEFYMNYFATVIFQCI